MQQQNDLFQEKWDMFTKFSLIPQDVLYYGLLNKVYHYHPSPHSLQLPVGWYVEEYEQP